MKRWLVVALLLLSASPLVAQTQVNQQGEGIYWYKPGGSGGSGTVSGTSGNMACFTSSTAVGNCTVSSTMGTGIFLYPNSGSAAAPMFANAVQPATGFWPPSSSSIMFASNGTNQWFVTANLERLVSTSQRTWSSGDPGVSAEDTGMKRAAAGVVAATNGGAGVGWFQNAGGNSRVNGDVTNATNTMANITGLSATLIAGRKYTGELILKCNNSTAAEGIAVDFDGGNATMTSFAAGAGVLTGGTTVAVTTVSSAIATDFDWSTITGETWITFKITMVVNAAGTFIPRFRESTAHTSGTATVSLGSYLWLEDTP